MTEKHARGETHGCIVCGKLHELYVVYGSDGRFMGSKVMSAGARSVAHSRRALVACDRHTAEEIQRAVQRVYGEHNSDDEE